MSNVNCGSDYLHFRDSKVALWITVGVDDWTAERAIVAGNASDANVGIIANFNFRYSKIALWIHFGVNDSNVLEYNPCDSVSIIEFYLKNNKYSKYKATIYLI